MEETNLNIIVIPTYNNILDTTLLFFSLQNSLMGTVINLAQNFVGSNNINLLQPVGQFGTRLHGGKDAASPRYIFTMLSPLTRLMFQPTDEPSLNWLYDDNQRIEPEWYLSLIHI